jgi:hypothetical protein
MMLRRITFRGSLVDESHGCIFRNEVVELRELQPKRVVEVGSKRGNWNGVQSGDSEAAGAIGRQTVSGGMYPLHSPMSISHLQEGAFLPLSTHSNPYPWSSLPPGVGQE